MHLTNLLTSPLRLCTITDVISDLSSGNLAGIDTKEKNVGFER